MVQIWIAVDLNSVLDLLKLPIGLKSTLERSEIIPCVAESVFQKLFDLGLVLFVLFLVDPTESDGVEISFTGRCPEITDDIVPFFEDHFVLVHVIMLGPSLEVIDTVDTLLQARGNCSLKNLLTWIQL